MVGLFFLIKYVKKIAYRQGSFNKIFNNSNSLSSVILYENYQANKLFILDPPHDETIYNERVYPSVIYRINSKKLILNHINMNIGIQLLEFIY